jgi:hypothetical protein
MMHLISRHLIPNQSNQAVNVIKQRSPCGYDLQLGANVGEAVDWRC